MKMQTESGIVPDIWWFSTEELADSFAIWRYLGGPLGLGSPNGALFSWFILSFGWLFGWFRLTHSRLSVFGRRLGRSERPRGSRSERCRPYGSERRRCHWDDTGLQHGAPCDAGVCGRAEGLHLGFILPRRGCYEIHHVLSIQSTILALFWLYFGHILGWIRPILTQGTLAGPPFAPSGIKSDKLCI